MTRRDTWQVTALSTRASQAQEDLPENPVAQELGRQRPGLFYICCGLHQQRCRLMGYFDQSLVNVVGCLLDVCCFGAAVFFFFWMGEKWKE